MHRIAYSFGFDCDPDFNLGYPNKKNNAAKPEKGLFRMETRYYPVQSLLFYHQSLGRKIGSTNRSRTQDAAAHLARDLDHGGGKTAAGFSPRL